MNDLVFGYDKDVAEWVARRVPIQFDPKNLGPYFAVGVMNEGKPIAGFIYSRYRGHDIEITGAASSPRWARRGIICALLSYPFEQLNCVRVTMITAKRNHRARRLIRALGFKEEGLHALAYDGRNDACSYGLTLSAWRVGKFGPRLQSRSTETNGQP